MESNLYIQSLIYKYADLIDSGDYEGIGRLFAHGRITTKDPSNAGSQGYDEVLKLYQDSTRLYPDGTPKSKHLVTNLVVEVAKDDLTASARSYYTVLQKTEVLALQPIIAGRYEDSFHRVADHKVAEEDNKWHFKERIMIVDLVGDLSQHLLFELPPE